MAVTCSVERAPLTSQVKLQREELRRDQSAPIISSGWMSPAVAPRRQIATPASRRATDAGAAGRTSPTPRRAAQRSGPPGGHPMARRRSREHLVWRRGRWTATRGPSTRLEVTTWRCEGAVRHHAPVSARRPEAVLAHRRLLREMERHARDHDVRPEQQGAFDQHEVWL